jgi:predicted HicB family RNase H-like nuclease
MSNKANKSKYNKLYKDQSRVVVYVKPEVKATLAQEATDRGISLSELCNPSLEELTNAINKRQV